ncbi:RNA methyltransferase [Candidatus Wolfebacteria bacterium]|nr:MAG: RNA methyltransferase [Candidatus Wolfebacteria bacterium]
MKKNKLETILVMHNIRSAYNVGSMFRTADAASISEIYLSGYTPEPLDMFGRLRKDISKVALGAESTLPWKSFPTINAVISKLKKEGFYIIAIEQDKDSVPYTQVEILGKKKIAFIVGNEVRGLSKSALGKSDIVAEIPMKGEKESLNVSVALGVVLFRILGI